MNGQDFLDGLELDNDGVLYQEIGLVGARNSYRLVNEGNNSWLEKRNSPRLSSRQRH